MPAASIEFLNVRKLYGEVAAVNGVSFTIAARSLVTLLGPSGCGKTTILRMIAGLELPTSGTIRIGEADVTRIPAAERDVSMVFQSYALFPHLSVLDNVSYGLTVSGQTRAQSMQPVQMSGLNSGTSRRKRPLSLVAAVPAGSRLRQLRWKRRQVQQRWPKWATQRRIPAGNCSNSAAPIRQC